MTDWGEYESGGVLCYVMVVMVWYVSVAKVGRYVGR